MISNEHFKGSINSIILFLLCHNEEMYGYEIAQMVMERTDNMMSFTEGAIYPALHRLEQKGFITSRKERVSGRIRKYYSITPKGQTESNRQLASLQDLFNAMISIFGKSFAKGIAHGSK